MTGRGKSGGSLFSSVPRRSPLSPSFPPSRLPSALRPIPRFSLPRKQERDPFTDLRRLLQSSDLTLTGMLSDLD